jgi:hypothetical protein
LYNYIKEKVYRQNLSMYLNFLHGAKSKAFTGVHPPHWVFLSSTLLRNDQDTSGFATLSLRSVDHHSHMSHYDLVKVCH